MARCGPSRPRRRSWAQSDYTAGRPRPGAGSARARPGLGPPPVSPGPVRGRRRTPGPGSWPRPGRCPRGARRSCAGAVLSSQMNRRTHTAKVMTRVRTTSMTSRQPVPLVVTDGRSHVGHRRRRTCRPRARWAAGPARRGCGTRSCRCGASATRVSHGVWLLSSARTSRSLGAGPADSLTLRRSGPPTSNPH
jgi:hypothetical protein